MQALDEGARGARLNKDGELHASSPLSQRQTSAAFFGSHGLAEKLRDGFTIMDAPNGLSEELRSAQDA